MLVVDIAIQNPVLELADLRIGHPTTYGWNLGPSPGTQRELLEDCIPAHVVRNPVRIDREVRDPERFNTAFLPEHVGPAGQLERREVPFLMHMADQRPYRVLRDPEEEYCVPRDAQIGIVHRDILEQYVGSQRRVHTPEI
ncbi:MAG: hypothetical protein P4L69_15445 [Desulfosporosinus sp.]|nr:hypothetical protein [Desulfosporosinus sp.]